MDIAVILGLLGFFTSIVSGALGLGNGLLLLPIATLLLPIKKAIALMTIFFMVSNIVKIVLFRTHIAWRKVLLLWIGAIPAVFLGAMCMVYAPSRLLVALLGAVVLIYVLAEWAGIIPKQSLKTFGTISLSAAHGFVGGLVGDASVLRVPLMFQLGLIKESFIATSAVLSLGINICKTIVYSKYSFVSAEDLPLLLALTAAAIAGNVVGKQLVAHMSPEVFKRAVLIVLVLVSLKLIFTG